VKGVNLLDDGIEEETTWLRRILLIPNTPKTAANKATKLEDFASDENTGLSRVLAEVDVNSNQFLDALTALELSPMYEHMRAALKLPKGFDDWDIDVLAARMYLAGRFDRRGEPSGL
jgi:hypothetical protein